MKLAYFTNRNKLTAQLYTNEGHFIHGYSEKISPILPAFKSGDRWIVDIGEGMITMVGVWINPDDGVIKVTPFGSMRRQSFSIVKRWLIKLEGPHDH